MSTSWGESASRASPALHRDDRELVQRVLDGDEHAWHDLVQEYDGLIRHVLRRYSACADERDGWHAEVLEELRVRKLARYDGRSALSTWVALITRNLALDRVRRKLGRRAEPRGLRFLKKPDRVIYRLFYQQGFDVEGVAHRLSCNGKGVSRRDVLEALWRIRDAVSDRTLQRALDDLVPPVPRVLASDLLSTLDQEMAGGGGQDPARRLLLEEARSLAKEVLAYVDRLPSEERRILELRHRRGWSAGRIAAEMHLVDRRKAYSTLDRIYRRIRRVFGARWSETREL